MPESDGGWCDWDFDDPIERSQKKPDKRKTVTNDSEMETVRLALDHDQIPKLYLVVLADSGVFFCWEDLAFLRDKNSPMSLRGRACTLSGVKNAIQIWLEASYPGKGLKATFSEHYFPQDGDFKSRVLFDSLTISGATQEIADQIHAKIDDYNRPKKGVGAWLSRRRASLGF